MVSDPRRLNQTLVGYGNNNLFLQNIVQVAKVIVHENYKIDRDPKHSDIALVMLSKPLRKLTICYRSSRTSQSILNKFRFKLNKVAPICLPSTDTGDLNVELTAAGWGKMKLENETCYTDQYGPVRFGACSTECSLV